MADKFFHFVMNITINCVNVNKHLTDIFLKAKYKLLTIFCNTLRICQIKWLILDLQELKGFTKSIVQ